MPISIACGKVRFDSKRSAQVRRNEIRRGRGRSKRHDRRDMRIYHCTHCDGWHLTSQPRRNP